MAGSASGMLMSPQWRLANIQLVNWGSFDGYHSIDLASDSPDGKPGITMITGASGSGKSALCDSNTQVLMPANARLKFNSASNKALNTRRGGERTVKTYVRGKVDTVHAQDGAERERFLRPADTAQWSSIAYTYTNVTGEEYCIARFFYLKAHDADDVPKAFYVTSPVKIDPLLMNRQSGRAFTQGVLRNVYPAATVHDGPTRFMDAVCAKLCIGGDAGPLNALKLLWRVQAGYPVDDVDGLYKELVIDRPRTFELAQRAVETFDENEGVWQQLDLARRKLDVLEGIIDWHDQLEEAQANVAIIEALGRPRRSQDDPFELGGARDATPFGLWSQRRQRDMAAGEVGRLEDEQRRLSVQKREIDEERAEIARKEAHVTALIAESGGARLDVIDNDIEQARAWVAERESQRAQYAALARALDEELPEDKDSFEDMRKRLRELASDAEADRATEQEKRDGLVVKEAAVRDSLDKTCADLEYYLEHKVNITPAMIAAREVASRASGIPVEDLPFAAELIDVADDEERWRDAANIALHGLASTLLVDKRELDRFSRSIDSKRHEMGMRLNFIGVDLGRVYRSAPNEGCLSSKMIYKESSPFIGWVKSQVNEERADYRCVEGPELLGGREAKITPSGQTRRGMRGAHGHGRHFRIIGLSNEQLIDELRERKRGLEAECARIGSSREAADESIRALDDFMRAAARIDELEWVRIDVASVKAKLDELLEERERLNTDAKLRELREKREALILERDEKSQELGVVNDALARCSADIVQASALMEQAGGRLGEIEAGGASLSDEAAAWLDELADDLGERIAGRVSRASVEDFSQRMIGLVKDRRARMLREGSSARASLAKAFATYHRDFLDSDPNYSVDPEEGYADYLGILEELLEKRLDEPEEAWTMRLLRQTAQSLVPLQEAFSAEVRTIKERLQPINEIMAHYPFGPRAGTLSIVTEDRGNASIAEFKRRLAKWSAYAFADEPPANFQNEHRKLVRFMDALRADLAAGECLDVRKLVDIKVVARWPNDPDRESSVFTKLGEKSGGETQELVAFILGGALLYYLGDNGDRLPSYSTVFLDEAFIKADAKFTRRAIAALRGLGFQIVIAIPEDKVESISPVADKFICVVKDAGDRSRVNELDRVEAP